MVELRVLPRWNNYTTCFFATAAVPRELSQENLPSQWRLDLPQGKQCSERMMAVCSIGKKILLSSRLVSPHKLVAELEEHFPYKERSEIAAATYAACIHRDVRFEGKLEARLYKILENAMGANLPRNLLQNVWVSSLTGRRSQSLARWVIDAKTPLVVEIGHSRKRSQDDRRDRALRACGCQVFRIHPKEILRGEGNVINALLSEITKASPDQLTPYGHYVNALKIGHQIQVACLELLSRGLTEKGIRFDSESIVLPKQETDLIVRTAINDFNALLACLCAMYAVEFHPLSIVQGGGITITYNQSARNQTMLTVIEDIAFPREITATEISCKPIKPNCTNGQARMLCDWLGIALPEELARAILERKNVVCLVNVHDIVKLCLFHPGHVQRVRLEAMRSCEGITCIIEAHDVTQIAEDTILALKSGVSQRIVCVSKGTETQLQEFARRIEATYVAMEYTWKHEAWTDSEEFASELAQAKQHAAPSTEIAEQLVKGVLHLLAANKQNEAFSLLAHYGDRELGLKIARLAEQQHLDWSCAKLYLLRALATSV